MKYYQNGDKWLTYFTVNIFLIKRGSEEGRGWK